MVSSNTYHLPDNSYWVCNSQYNGLSQLAKAKPTSARISDACKQIGVLKNTKIPTRIAAQLS